MNCQSNFVPPKPFTFCWELRYSGRHRSGVGDVFVLRPWDCSSGFSFIFPPKVSCWVSYRAPEVSGLRTNMCAPIIYYRASNYSFLRCPDTKCGTWYCGPGVSDGPRSPVKSFAWALTLSSILAKVRASRMGKLDASCSNTRKQTKNVGVGKTRRYLIRPVVYIYVSTL